MHAPFTLRSTLGEIKAAAPKRKRAWAIAVVVIVGVAVTTYFARRPLQRWMFGPSVAALTPVLPETLKRTKLCSASKPCNRASSNCRFDEGQSVDAGTLIARLDDSGYRQQVAINQAALDVAQRQLAAAEQDLTAARQTVESDVADLEFRQQEYVGASGRCWRRAPALLSSAIKLTRHCGSPRPRTSATKHCVTPPNGKLNLRRLQSAAPKKHSKCRKSFSAIPFCTRRSLA